MTTSDIDIDIDKLHREVGDLVRSILYVALANKALPAEALGAVASAMSYGIEFVGSLPAEEFKAAALNLAMEFVKARDDDPLDTNLLSKVAAFASYAEGGLVLGMYTFHPPRMAPRGHVGQAIIDVLATATLVPRHPIYGPLLVDLLNQYFQGEQLAELGHAVAAALAARDAESTRGDN